MRKKFIYFHHMKIQKSTIISFFLALSLVTSVGKYHSYTYNSQSGIPFHQYCNELVLLTKYEYLPTDFLLEHQNKHLIQFISDKSVPDISLIRKQISFLSLSSCRHLHSVQSFSNRIVTFFQHKSNYPHSSPTDHSLIS